MTFKLKALALGCMATMGMVSANAIQVAEIGGTTLEVYGSLYPQYQTTDYSDSFTPLGGKISNMTTGTTGTAVVSISTNAFKKTQLNWVNSYIGFKGSKKFGDLKVGFDLQGVVAGASGSSLLSDTRDAYIYLQGKEWGTLSIGQLDSIYKQYGDRVRMLGISSSNFVSTASIVSGTSWRAPTSALAGTTSFNTRIAGQIRYESPNFNGFQVGYSHRPDPTATATKDASLSAISAKWSNANYYVALGHEIHNDYKTFSGTVSPLAPSPSIRNLNPRSRDTATRLSVGYKAGALQLGGDYAKLMYTESGSVGRFESYDTKAWQLSADYAVNAKVNIAANYAKGSEGSCNRVGGATCSTEGLGGNLMSLGAKYSLDKNIAFYGIYGKHSNNASANFGSPTNVGGSVKNMAVGVLVKF